MLSAYISRTFSDNNGWITVHIYNTQTSDYVTPPVRYFFNFMMNERLKLYSLFCDLHVGLVRISSKLDDHTLIMLKYLESVPGINIEYV